MILLYTHENDSYKSQITKLDVASTSYFNEEGFLICNIQSKNLLLEGYYAIKVDYNLLKSKWPKYGYFLVYGEGNSTDDNNEKSFSGIQNRLLIDADYEHDYVFGVYFTKSSLFMCTTIQMKFRLEFFDLENQPDVEFYSKTQSPVFNSAPFPNNSHFHSLYRSTEGACGYDIVMMNYENIVYIHPTGNFVVDLSDSVETASSGDFLLRSRFTRMGCTLTIVGPGIFQINNHSSWPIGIVRRMFQYVPLKTFNGKVCNTSSVISSSCSFKTIEQVDDKIYDPTYKFGAVVTNKGAKRKAKC